MDDRSHAREARDHLRRIDVGDDPELEAHRAEAVAAVETLLDRLETGPVASSVGAETEVPDPWDDSALAARVDTAREKAGVGGTTGTLTTKTINGNDYYYLQWREGDQVKSQYVAPVDPD